MRKFIVIFALVACSCSDNSSSNSGLKIDQNIDLSSKIVSERELNENHCFFEGYGRNVQLICAKSGIIVSYKQKVAIYKYAKQSLLVEPLSAANKLGYIANQKTLSSLTDKTIFTSKEIYLGRTYAANSFIQHSSSFADLGYEKLNADAHTIDLIRSLEFLLEITLVTGAITDIDGDPWITTGTKDFNIHDPVALMIVDKFKNSLTRAQKTLYSVQAIQAIEYFLSSK